MRYSYKERCRKRLRVDVFEEPLPSNETVKKAIVFELCCPPSLAAYRDSTWLIMGILGRVNFPQSTSTAPPRMMLREYAPLKTWTENVNSHVTLASSKKSYLQTHYSSLRLPVDLDEVFKQSGVYLQYYDAEHDVWVKADIIPIFSHHCEFKIPPDSPFSKLQFSSQLLSDFSSPSSYQIVASQAACPSNLGAPEYVAYQSLLSSKLLRWHCIVLELASSNLNFNEASTSLICHLASQAGPRYPRSATRDFHADLCDKNFCHQLLDQISNRMNNIRTNWREIYSMDMLLTLLLRIISIRRDGLPNDPDSPDLIDRATSKVNDAREITVRWMRSLLEESLQATTVESSETISRYTFWSAILCRRTYAMFMGTDSFPAALVGTYIGTSIVLRDHLPLNIFKQPPLVKQVLRRDVRLVFRLRLLIRSALISSPQIFLAGLGLVWPQAEGAPPRAIHSASFPSCENEHWYQATLSSADWAKGQTLRFHVLQGTLLVDGKPIGKLPQEYIKSTIVQRLFGPLNLRTATSSCPGMEYQILQPMNGHVVHLGARNGQLVARAYVDNTVLEYVPQQVFRSNVATSFDLPAPLIDGCVHWLDLNSKIIEIRSEAQKWHRKFSAWKLNLQTFQANRRGSVLLDPNGLYFQQLANCFRTFESIDQLVVYQTSKTVCCEIRRLNLNFNVSPKGSLHCRQYGYIDVNQDAGTWYGLASKLVFKDACNPQKRYILVPTGYLTYKRQGIHVDVNIENNGGYLTYTINDLVGRIDSPADPMLVYAKGMFHALTSFPVADPLTGRTGTEEAIDFLTSGMCQPWAPLPTLQVSQCLSMLAKISPRRHFYPEDLKVMQRVHWDANLPTAVQHEAFRDIAESICQTSQNLSIFALQAQDKPVELGACGDSFLSTRAQVRRAVHERPSSRPLFKDFPRIVNYELREGRRDLLAKVYNIVNLVGHECSSFATTEDLTRYLSQFTVIGGFTRCYDKTLMNLFRVDFELEFGSLAKFCQSTPLSDKYKLEFFFALLLYAHPYHEELIRTLLGYALIDDVKRLSLPLAPFYTNPHPRMAPSVRAFVQLINAFRVPYVQNVVTSGTITLDRRMRARLAADERAYNERVEQEVKALAEHLVRQWPSGSLSFDGFSSELIEMDDARGTLEPEWERLVHNRHLMLHLQDVQQILNAHAANTKFLLPSYQREYVEELIERPRGGEVRHLSVHLFGNNALETPTLSVTASGHTHSEEDHVSAPHAKDDHPAREDIVISELRNITSELASNKSNVYQSYSKTLVTSIDALAKRSTEHHSENTMPNIFELDARIQEAYQIVNQHFQTLRDSFARGDSSAKWLQLGGVWPSITTVTLLQQLRLASSTCFGTNMRKLLTIYAVSITSLQRLLRIDDALRRKDLEKARIEWSNNGHENWEPLDVPEWLLLEIECNILFRSVQVDVARETIDPRSGSNSVLQMNMGQGKTSCVIPMSAIALADKKQLMRVVVPKALLFQTCQLLQARIGGLVGRRIIHIPFSRRTSTSSDTVKLFRSMLIRTLKQGGLVIALPEHMLSFSLSGLQRLSEDRIDEAKYMIDTQRWLQRVCRDIMDESDFTLACKTQLIYPSGSQINFDGGNHRWETAEMLLAFVQDHLWDLQRRFASSIEVVQRHDGYPLIFFLRQDVQDELLSKLVNNICSGHFSLVPVVDCSPSERAAIRAFLTNATVGPKTLAQISELCPDKPAIRNVLYLLRGLIVHRILLMTLSRRWNVQYGLHPARDPIAVPYSAKGVPSETSEWGHPDVSVLFTILSFYYSGLTINQVRQTLDYILKSDDPAAEYDTWVSGIESFPDSLRDCFSINLEDSTQVNELLGYLRYRTRMINCFLNFHVFPCHAKQFNRKLQASSWDLPLFSVNKKNKALTTGFSGTNDNRDMLPMTIKQHDLHSLSHTNAEVLAYLLQHRNRNFVLAAHRDGKRLSEVDLLKRLKVAKIRILIDAGAQILELDNAGLARQWLQEDHEAAAAVYFDSGNKAMVLYRNDRVGSLVASPFVDNLGDVLVYLDEA
ncbi:MAG: hypothetical protein Q9160_005373 [Pyrenula sp. 1 TL-2023]